MKPLLLPRTGYNTSRWCLQRTRLVLFNLGEYTNRLKMVSAQLPLKISSSAASKHRRSPARGILRIECGEKKAGERLRGKYPESVVGSVTRFYARTYARTYGQSFDLINFYVRMVYSIRPIIIVWISMIDSFSAAPRDSITLGHSCLYTLHPWHPPSRKRSITDTKA